MKSKEKKKRLKKHIREEGEGQGSEEKKRLSRVNLIKMFTYTLENVT